MNFSETRTRFATLPVMLPVAAMLIAVALGAIVPGYVDAMGDSAARLMALPAALVLTFLLAYSRTALLLAIIVLRAAGDVALESTRFSLGGAQIGIGGLINAFAILIAALLVLERPQLLPRGVWRTWGAFLVIGMIGIVLTPDRGAAIRLYLQLLSTFAIFIGAIYVVQSPGDFRRCIGLVVASSLVPVLFGFYQLATGERFASEDGGYRIQSTFSHPNILAFYLTLVISLAFYLIKSPRPDRKRIVEIGLVLYLFALLAMLLMTKTRSAWVACAVMFAAYGLLFERRYLVYLVVAGALALFIPGVGDRVFEVTSEAPVLSSLTPLNSFQWRVSIWESSLAWMTPPHYVLGYGLESFPFYSTTFFKEANNIRWGAHNVYVELFFEIGALGVGAFLWMYLYVLRQLRAMYRFDRLGAFVLSTVVIEYLVTAASDNLLQYLSFNWYVWFACGAGVAIVTKQLAGARDDTERRPFAHLQAERHANA